MHTDILPDITIRFTAHDHVDAYTRLRKAAEWQLKQATTAQERRDAEQWVDSADRQLLRWQAVLARQAVQS